ncbi:serine/threonine protein kinase [Pendulispora brunnea]|uniref:Serine/threonine protein kinase n=1 Tax=Pendulispora brunnea TaxID=2905690 RepID=A0ABZ2KFS0_9BACT
MVEAAFTRGAILGRKYTLGDIIGEGPTGAIFAAEERFRAQRVAIKVAKLPASIRTRQFMRDTEAAQAVRSENVIFVYDVGVEGDTPYVVTEWLEGKNLAELAAEYGPFPVGEAVGYVLQACNGLQELHAARVAHRNIKPSNLFLTKAADGGPLVKILDVGLSSTEFALEGEAEGALLDALKFASPERLVARPRSGFDARTDVWSLAVTLYVLVTGKFPFDGASTAEVREAIARGVFPKLSERLPDAPRSLDEVIALALTTEADGRTASMADFARALEPFAMPPSVSVEAASPSPMVEDLASLASPAAPPPPPEDIASVQEESAPAVEEPPPPRESVRTAAATDAVELESRPSASVPPDRTAPGAITAVPPASSAGTTAPSTSRRSMVIAAAAVVLLVGFAARLGRSPAAPEPAAPPAETRLLPDEAVTPQAQDTTPASAEETPAPSATAHDGQDGHDAGASASPPRRSRRR